MPLHTTIQSSAQSPTNDAVDDTFQLIFSDDELPEEFPKNVRRPIAKHRVKEAVFKKDEEFDDGLLGLSDHDDRKSTLTGGKAVIPRRITTELDETDKLILDMKGIGCHERLIQEELINRGLTRYEEKSIATRATRLVKVIATKEAGELDDELTDWHEGDDELLRESYAAHEKHLQDDLAAAYKRHWNRVSQTMHYKLDKKKYSFNACRERFNALDAGTAEPTFEEDPDQAGRIANRAARKIEIVDAREARKLRREQEVEEERATELRRQQRREAKAQRAAKMDASYEQRVVQKAKKDAAKEAARIERIAAAKEDHEGKKQAERDAEAKKAAAQQAKIDKKEERDKAAHQKKANKEAQKDAARLKKLDEQVKKAEKKVEDAKQDAKLKAKLDEVLSQVPPPPRKKTLKELEPSAVNAKNDGSAAPKKPAYILGTPLKHGAAPSMDPMKSPRNLMDKEALVKMLKGRGLPSTGTKKALVIRLFDSDHLYTREEVVKILRERNLTTFGTKEELIRRIASHDAGLLEAGGSATNRKRTFEQAGLEDMA